MARAYSIHVLRSDEGPIMAAFTVRHELLACLEELALQDHDLRHFMVESFRDGEFEANEIGTTRADIFLKHEKHV